MSAFYAESALEGELMPWPQLWFEGKHDEGVTSESTIVREQSKCASSANQLVARRLKCHAERSRASGAKILVLARRLK